MFQFSKDYLGKKKKNILLNQMTILVLWGIYTVGMTDCSDVRGTSWRIGVNLADRKQGFPK